MTTSAASPAAPARQLPRAPARPGGPAAELWAFGLLALAASLPVFWGAVAEALVFLPVRVAEGQWWRLLTHPFAHVSWYHLLLDGAGFLLLYAGLREPGRAGRLVYVLGAWAGSMLLPLALSPDLYAVGLCGLSGTAHGLLAVSGAEGLASRDTGDRRTGALCLGLVVAKSAWELAAGRAFLSALHFGLMGVPVVACHLGGVLGGLGAFGALRVVRRFRDRAGEEQSHARQTRTGGRTSAGAQR
ncbi:MAG: rhombosortase [Thermodesulfobacteriota bacterium]